jgi:hypothetical protein
MVGKPEVTLGPDFFGGQVVNALYIASGSSETDLPLGCRRGTQRFAPSS